MLFQRASMDEFRQLAMSLTQTGLDTTLIRKAMVAKVRDVIRCIQHFSRTGKREEGDVKSKLIMRIFKELFLMLFIVSEKDSEAFNSSSTNIRGEDIKMMIPENIDLWELMTETADQLYSFVSAE